MRVARVAVLAVAVAAAGGAYYLTQSARAPRVVDTASAPPAPALSTDDVIVAAHDLPVGKLIMQGDLSFKPWPKDSIGVGMVRQADGDKSMTDLNGSIVRFSVLAGEPIRRERLVKGPNAGFLSAVLPSGKRAVAINIDSNGGTSAGGFILPNDRVDVIRTVKPEGTGGGDVISETLLRNIKVLAIGQNVEDKNGQPVVVGSNATLELEPVQAETIILAQRTGQLSLVLRSMLDAQGEPVQARQEDRATTIVRYGVPSESSTH